MSSAISRLSESSADLLAGVAPVAASPMLLATLAVNVPLATLVHSEAARSTWIVGPVLSEFWVQNRDRVSVYAGVEFVVDKRVGLNGYCDFLIGQGPQLPHVQAPLALLFEAKRDSIPGGLGQCIAGMVGVQRYNRDRGRDREPIYGGVTTGSLWKFLALSGTTVTIDQAEYTITQVDRLLGILTHIIGPG